MSVLAYVVSRGAIQSEPAATQALEFILNASPDMAQTFLGRLGPSCASFEPGRITAELAQEGSRPDLTIHDRGNHARVFVENKFWAGLTDAQPVCYLRDLPEDPPSALVFIVPEQRVSTVWNELRARCHEAGLECNNCSGTQDVIGARVGRRTMLITSWRYVLDGLLDAASDTVRQDVHQLRGLTDQMDSQAFLPLRADEPSSQETARRLINYGDLIQPIAEKLKTCGVADLERWRLNSTWFTTGRHLRLHDRFGVWLGIDLRVWRDCGITPLWLHIGSDKFSGVAGRFEAIRYLFKDAKVDEKSAYLYVPIRLKSGSERERVIDDAANQIERIADTLQAHLSNA